MCWCDCESQDSDRELSVFEWIRQTVTHTNKRTCYVGCQLIPRYITSSWPRRAEGMWMSWFTLTDRQSSDCHCDARPMAMMTLDPLLICDLIWDVEPVETGHGDCKMVNGSRYYRALESVSTASALSSALTIYPCQIRVHQRSSEEGVAAGHSGQFTPCGYLSTLIQLVVVY